MVNRQSGAPWYRQFLILLIVLNLCFIFILLFPTLFAGYPWDSSNLAIQSFFSKADRFADFYNPAQYAMDRNLMNDAWTNSPPFLHFCGYAASAVIGLLWPGRLQNYFGGGNAFGQSRAGYFFWLAIVIVTVLIVCRQCRRLLNSKAGYFYGFFAVALCYPFLYAVDRGNYIVFVVMLLALFMADYADHPYRAAVWLGIAAALKLYPAILGVLFLRRKRLWRPALVCAGTGIGLTLLSLLFFSGGQHTFMLTFTDWLTKMKQYTVIGNGSVAGLLSSSSLHTIPYLISDLHHPAESMQQLLQSRAGWLSGKAIFLFLVFTCYACLCMKKEHDIFLICSLMMICYPVDSATYNLALAIIPLIYWVWKEPNHFTVAAMGFALLLDTKCIICYVLRDGISIPLSSLLNPVLCFSMIVFLLVLRRDEWISPIKRFIPILAKANP